MTPIITFYACVAFLIVLLGFVAQRDDVRVNWLAAIVFALIWPVSISAAALICLHTWLVRK